MIRDTRNWNLYLALDRESIDVMAYNPMEDQSLLNATITLDPAETDRCKAIEEAVYDNPLLLNDFKRVTVISRNLHRAIVPDYVLDGGEELASDITRDLAGCPDDNPGAPLVIDRLPLLDCSISHFIDEKVYNFLTRTFTGVRFIHRLSSLTRYFHGVNRGTGSFVSYVDLRPGSFDLVMFNGNSLLLANSYDWTEPDDIIYYLLAVRHTLGVEENKAVVLTGDRAVREQVMPLMRRFIPTVMPAVFPAAMFRAGGTVALDTPTDLVVLPLCE